MAFTDIAQQATDAVHDFLPGAITEGKNHGDSGILTGGLDTAVQFFLTGLGKIGKSADRLEPDIVRHHAAQLFLEEPLQQGHQGRDFRFGTLPILGGEGVEGEKLHPKVIAGFDAAGHRIGPGPVALDALPALLLGPASVAIHDDGNVTGDGIGTDVRGEGHGISGLRHRDVLSKTHRILQDAMVPNDQKGKNPPAFRFRTPRFRHAATLESPSQAAPCGIPSCP